MTRQLIRDAGYDSVSAGGLENARMLEESLALIFAVNQGWDGPILLPLREARRALAEDLDCFDLFDLFVPDETECRDDAACGDARDDPERKRVAARQGRCG